MKSNPLLNGSDQLMRGFDYESRRRGFAGNHCQITLEIDRPIPVDALKARLAELQSRFPILHSRIGGFFQPAWKRRARKEIPVRVHPAALDQLLFNQPLRLRRCESMRFDLAETGNGRTKLVLTWTHALMDATTAEWFLAAVGDPQIQLPDFSPPPRATSRMKWPERLELMKKTVEQLDRFCEQQPRSLPARHSTAPRQLRYRLESFSADETARVRANGARLCGVLGAAQFHAVAAVMELHRLHLRLGCPTKSYLLPMPVGLRPKGRIDPMFSNQVDMLMLQFLPEQLESAEQAAAALKSQMTQALRDQSVSRSRLLSEMFSFLPLPIYMAVLKHGLKGEICSLFFGDTAAVNPRLEKFFDRPVARFAHIAAVTPSPGLGVIFYCFRGELSFTVVHALTVLDESEAADFAAAVRARLLQP